MPQKGNAEEKPKGRERLVGNLLGSDTVYGHLFLLLTWICLFHFKRLYCYNATKKIPLKVFGLIQIRLQTHFFASLHLTPVKNFLPVTLTVELLLVLNEYFTDHHHLTSGGQLF